MGIQSDGFKLLEDKAIIYSTGRICETADEFLRSQPFRTFLETTLRHLADRNSRLIIIFGSHTINKENITLLIEVFYYLTILDRNMIPNILPESEMFFKNPNLLADFVEYLYNAWRDYDRILIVSGFQGDALDDRPYRTFNETVEKLMHLVRGTYRDIKENIDGQHPRIFRQARAGVNIATIVSKKAFMSAWMNGHGPTYTKLQPIPIIRHVLLYPPLVLNPPMNRRTGQFQRVDENPLDRIDLNQGEWICYPAKVGELLITTYIHEKFLELGLSLCNLFELASDEDLEKQPDAVYLFGVPGDVLDCYGSLPTVFYDDQEGDILVGAVPNEDRFGYFGYLKKMILTLHNIKMMKRGRMPFHGAMVEIILNDKTNTIVLVGDSGAGKSETLEAFRVLCEGELQDMVIIADDMGTINIENGIAKGYGTEIGAFIRLDDLQPGYEFGQMGRAIFMSPTKINARLLLPVVSYPDVVRGSKIDMIFYANNYQEVDEDHLIIERFSDSESALEVFREGTVMSKGTTTSEGIAKTYFANVFGPPQYKDLHEDIAQSTFEHLFDHDVFLGQIRTRLGLPGWEIKGPEAAARAMIELITKA